MRNVKIPCDISACFVISLKEDQSILNKLESKFIIIVVSRTRKSKCGAHLFVTIESYSMWSLVRVFSENDKIFRQEKKYVE